jgi:catechol 2,3-dioxygenase-like lactoylglutathione lyase family enzyme
MNIRRVVPNIASSSPDLCREFYIDFLGMKVAMDLGWLVTYASPSNPTAQINVARGDGAGAASPSLSITIEVDDVDAMHTQAVFRGYPIAKQPTNEPWGVRRFFVHDPNGVLINIMSHLPPPADGPIIS